MARLAIGVDFLAEYAALGKPVQSAVEAAISKFAEHTHAGLHLEKITQSKDHRIARSGSTVSGAGWCSLRTPETSTA